jgi:dolichol-phosphate mannosyltransferase
MQPKYIPAMVAKQAATQCDVVTGTRYAPGGGVFGWDFTRKLTSRGANLLAQLLLQPHMSDLTGSFRLYKREVFDRVIRQVASKVRAAQFRA